MTDTVCTLFELRAGDDTVNEGKVMNEKSSEYKHHDMIIR